MSAPSSDTAGIRQTIRVLRKAGYRLDSVDNGFVEKVRTEAEAIAEIMAVDDAHLYVTHDGAPNSWVRFVMGNEPEEVIADHGTSLDHVLDPLMDRWIS